MCNHLFIATKLRKPRYCNLKEERTEDPMRKAHEGYYARGNTSQSKINTLALLENKYVHMNVLLSSKL